MIVADGINAGGVLQDNLILFPADYGHIAKRGSVGQLQFSGEISCNGSNGEKQAESSRGDGPKAGL